MGDKVRIQLDGYCSLVARIGTRSVVRRGQGRVGLIRMGEAAEGSLGASFVAGSVGYHASRFALAYPCVGWVRLSGCGAYLCRNMTMPRGRQFCSHPGRVVLLL